MLTSLYKPEDNIDQERFNKEIFFYSFIAHSVAEREGRKDCSLTRFVKTAASYVEDWDIIAVGHHFPYFGIKPNPYGIVAAVPEAFGGKVLFLDDLVPITRKENLWNIEISSDGKKYVTLCSNSATLRETLSGIDNETKFEFSFDGSDLDIASFLAEVYAQMSTRELNISASHRDLIKSKSCFEYAFRKWETNFQEIIESARDLDFLADSENEDFLANGILKMAASCGQIELKTEYALTGIRDVAERLDEISYDFDGLEQSFIQKIIRYMTRNAFIESNSIEAANLCEQYILNRKYIYPITNALINIFEIYHDSHLHSRKEIKDMNKACMREAIIESKCECGSIDGASTIELYIEEIEDTHNSARREAKTLLIPFKGAVKKSSGPLNLEENKDWDVTDGTEEEESSA